MMLSVVLSIGLRLTKDDTEINQGENRRERHDETSEEGKNCECSKSKPDDFLRAKYEHMMGSFGLINCRS